MELIICQERFTIRYTNQLPVFQQILSVTLPHPSVFEVKHILLIIKKTKKHNHHVSRCVLGGLILLVRHILSWWVLHM